MISHDDIRRAEEIIERVLGKKPALSKSTLFSLRAHIASAIHAAQERGAESLSQHLLDIWKESRRPDSGE